MSIFVVMGAWLSDDYGLSVAGLGAIATGIGAAELAPSSAVAVVADRIGIRRSVGIGGLLLGLGLVVIALERFGDHRSHRPHRARHRFRIRVRLVTFSHE